MTRRPGRPVGSSGPDGQHGREAILKAARELLAELGTARVTLRSVADRAGVQPPLVNYYFGTKADLFEAVIGEVATDLRNRLTDIAEDDGTPEARLRAFVSGVVQGLAADPFTPRLMAELVIFPDDERTDRFFDHFGRSSLESLSKILRDGIEAGCFRPVDPQVFAPALYGSCLFYFLGAPGLRRMLDFEPLDPEQIERYAEQVGKLLLDGIVA